MYFRSVLLLAAALCFLTLCFLTPVPASAQSPMGQCAIGPGLGATLLYPYFETHLNSFNGRATLLSFNNSSAQPALVRVTLWTDLGHPTLAFDVYMKPFSLSSLNLRDTMNGGIPSTGEGADLSGFEGCDEKPPFHSNPALDADHVAQLRADHTGQQGPVVGSCVGSPTTDGIARGYVTIDVVDECSGINATILSTTPLQSHYFSDGDGTGVAINDNILWGDIFYLSNDEASAHGSAAISLWADAEMFAGDDIHTFYGKLFNWDGRDNRVPLPTTWNTRFINGGPFAGGASLIVYHDSGLRPRSFPCGELPDDFPMSGNLVALNGQGEDLISLDSEFPTVGGLVSQRASIGDLAIPYPFGWLQATSRSEGSQMWIQPTLSGSGLYSASLDATPTLSSCTFSP